MSLLGTLDLQSLVRAAVVNGSVEQLDMSNNHRISRPIQEAVKQEAIIHLLRIHAANQIGTAASDREIVDGCLTIASTMLDLGDCTQGTFVRLQNELPKCVHEWRDTSPSSLSRKAREQAMQIIDRVLEASVVGYSAEELKVVQEFQTTRQQCETQGQKVVNLLYGQVRACVPTLMAKYPALKDVLSGPFLTSR